MHAVLPLSLWSRFLDLAVSLAAALILPPINLNLKLSHRASFFSQQGSG